MVFILNQLDLQEYIAEGGIAFQFNEVEGPNSDTDFDGIPIQDHLVDKLTWNVHCMSMSADKAAALLSMLRSGGDMVLSTDYPYVNSTTYTVRSASHANSLLVVTDATYLKEITFSVVAYVKRNPL